MNITVATVTVINDSHNKNDKDSSHNDHKTIIISKIIIIMITTRRRRRRRRRRRTIMMMRIILNSQNKYNNQTITWSFEDMNSDIYIRLHFSRRDGNTGYWITHSTFWTA